ncbi:MAG: SxtJ family membrane protein [bacterium]
MKEFFKNIWQKWKKIAHVFGRFQTRLLVTIFYFLIISPIGLIMKLFGWDPLKTKKSKAYAGTNWQTIINGEPDLESIKRQS